MKETIGTNTFNVVDDLTSNNYKKRGEVSIENGSSGWKEDGEVLRLVSSEFSVLDLLFSALTDSNVAHWSSSTNNIMITIPRLNHTYLLFNPFNMTDNISK